LYGVPFAIKDNIDVAGLPTTAACPAYSYTPGRSAYVVQALVDAGAIPIGKTNMDQFATGLVGTRTPHGACSSVYDARYISGGSSSGSGATVAARSAFAAIGTDGGGSIRFPAALEGLVGLKPTCGRVSRYGVIPMSATLDHVGPLCRTAEDTALVMNVIAGFDPLDVQSINEPVPDYTAGLEESLRGLRLGVERDYFFYKDVSPEYRSIVEAAMAELEKLGVVFVDVKIPELDLCAGIFLNIIATDTSTYHRRWLREKPNDYVQGTRIMLEFGELLFGTDYLMAQRAREVLRSAVKDAFQRERLDGLIGPSNVVTAVHMSRYSSSLFEGSPEDSTGALHQLSIANVIGVPSMSVPCGFSSAGLPVGFVLYGRPFDEALLLRIGHAYGAVTPWTSRAPHLQAAAVR